MLETEGTDGVFWIPENPENRVKGSFSCRPGADAEVVLEGDLVDDPRVLKWAGGAGWKASAPTSVSAFLPIVIHGQLDNGEPLTLFDARNHGSSFPFGSPCYKADACIVGALVDGRDQLYTAVRLRIGHPYWLGHLADGSSTRVGDDGSVLVAIDDDEGNWLMYQPASPTTLGELETRVVYGCDLLVELATYREVSVSEVQVKIDGDWLDVLGDSFSASSHEYTSRTMLPREALTVALFASWIPLNDRLDGLSAAVAHKNRGPLEEDVLVATSLIEGLHRRLPYEHSKFPGASKSAVARIAKAAKRAASARAEVEGLDPQVANKAAMFLEEVDFNTRVADIAAEVCAAVPAICESVDDLPPFLASVRHSLAHHRLPNEVRDPLEIRGRRWIVAAAITRWLLRCLLLLRAGVPAEVLRENILAFNPFEMYLANTARIVEELVQLGAPHP